MKKSLWMPLLYVLFTLALNNRLLAQQDTVPRKSDSVARRLDTVPRRNDTFFLMRYKGLLGRLAGTIIVDTTTPPPDLQRNDQNFQRYRGKVIRNIQVHRVDFGTPINDTAKSFRNTLVRMADFFHHNTRHFVIRNNLFFKEGQKVFPYLFADNERHLRDQDYLRDARILIAPVKGSDDSVDVIVLTKDVLSLGGSASVSSVQTTEANIRDDNFMGLGHRLLIRGLYDGGRHTRFGYGAEYISRNIGGSFIDGTVGFVNFNPTLNTARKEESVIYTSFIKPLVHPYMRWTYGILYGYHYTSNMYVSDSLYNSDFRYSYSDVDAWGGFTMEVNNKEAKYTDERLRTLVSARVLQQRFIAVPSKYENTFFFRYANITGILGSMSIFRQDFYKTRYVFGFGRTEDVPEGIDVSVTAGWTEKQGRTRGYAGLNLQMQYFSKRDDYFNYTFRVGAFTKDKKFEDVDILVNMDYFSSLKTLGSWRQRTFVTVGFTQQLNEVLNEPLFLDSEFGLTEFRNDSLFGGSFRATAKVESVFFTNWSLIAFRFAPFVFAHASVINGNTPPSITRNLFSSLGAGVRVRNENLIFGTIELRGFYYPNKNFYNDTFKVEVATNLRFKYNTPRIRRPEFIITN
jgi:hypothetical protein